MDLKKLVHIYTAKNLIDAKIKKGFLSSKGINSFIFPDNSGKQLGGYFPTGYSTIHLRRHLIYVSKDNAKQAKKLLETVNKI